MLPEIWRSRGSLAGPSLDDFIERFFYGWPSFEKNAEVAWSPRVDVHESDKEITIDVEVPGIDKKDINVEVKDNTLTITGERKYEDKEEGTNCHRTERHYGRFERTFGLPETVEQEKVDANYNNGVLHLTLPKTEKALPKKVDIQVK